jgi:hypothetical protein
MKTNSFPCRALPQRLVSGILLLCLWIVQLPTDALAQEELPILRQGEAQRLTRIQLQNGGADQSQDTDPPETPAWLGERRKNWMRYSLLIGAPVVTLLYGSQVWNWGETNNWRWGRERWFQQDTDSGGADKWGHFYTHYLLNRVLYDLFAYTETSETRRLWYPVITTSIIGTMIEVGDAFTGKYGFSYEDLLADFAGIGLAFALDKYPELDRFIRFSAYYWPSKGFREFRTEEDKGMLNFPGDYSGWKFAFNVKLSGFKDTRLALPQFLHYLQLDLGYYTRNYTRYDQHDDQPPTRHLFYGVSVNFHELATLPPRNKGTSLVEQFLRYYYLPLGWLPSHTL